MIREKQSSAPWRARCRLVLFALLFLSPAHGLFAQSAEPAPGAARATFGGPDSVPNRIESDRLERGTLFELDFLNPYYAWKDRLKEDYGFTFGAAYVPLALKSSSSLPETDDTAASGVFRFSGFWELLGRGTDNAGALIYLFEHRHNYTDTLPAPFSIENLGNVGAIAIPFADDGWHLTNFYWNQKFAGGKLEAVAGFLDVTDFVDVYPLTSPWTDYFNFAFSIGVATMDLPDDAALGLAGGAWLTDRVYVIGGLQDVNSNPNIPLRGFDNIANRSEFFKHIELGWTGSTQEQYYLDNIHVTAWHVNRQDRSDLSDSWGAVMSFTHMLDDHWQAFARGGFSNGGGSLLKKSVSVGFGYQPRPVRAVPADQLGFGFNWGRPNDDVFGPDLRDQFAIEGYYRLQVTREFAITPDVQLLINPALNPDKDTVWVFGLRGRLAF